jgi:LmbE family N-acetylglucosaminyl deacetylase
MPLEGGTVHRSLCAVFAHPDDEAFSSGGALARYASEGVETHLITATVGEAGELHGQPADPNELAALREPELREAARILGVTRLHLLRLPDGHLADDPERLETAIRTALAEIRPQVVLTEDALGITGHPDHIAVTRATIRAFDSLPGRDLLKLYEHVVPRSVLGEEAPIQGTPDDYITSWIDVGRWREQMAGALAAHRSQDPDRFVARIRTAPGPWIEHYVCIRSRVPIIIPEDDLFSGIR